MIRLSKKIRVIGLVYSLAFFAALAFFSPARAQTMFAVEYDFHKVHKQDRTSHYWATGIIQPTKYGTVDAWLQGSRNYSIAPTDNLNGWELGYSYMIPVGKFTLLPRIAYGAMNNIDFGGGAVGNARYLLTTIEGAYPLRENLSIFASASHTKGMNDDAIQSWNRLTAGTDIVINPKISLRLGASYIRQLQASQYGAYGIVTYTLGE